jgi:hypothetical protein
VSARSRRRLLWAGGVLVAVLVGVVIYLVVPNQRGGIATPEQTGTVQLVPRTKQVPVTAEARASIDSLFDRFVPAAIARRDPGSARPYVTANLWSQATPAQWRAGSIPVPPYEPAGTTFHGWSTLYSYPRLVGVRLTLEPRRSGDPVGSFVVNVKRVGPRWLVDQIYEEGLHGGAAAAPAPATPKASAPRATTTANADTGLHGQIGGIWLFVPLGLLSLVVIVPAILFTRHWWTDRKVKRRYRTELSKELPPLPRPRNRDQTSR